MCLEEQVNILNNYYHLKSFHDVWQYIPIYYRPVEQVFFENGVHHEINESLAT